MHCFILTAPYAVLSKLAALRLEYVHYRLNWAEKGVVNARRILLHYMTISSFYDELDALLQFNYETCRTAEIGCTLSRMRALPSKLGGKRCIWDETELLGRKYWHYQPIRTATGHRIYLRIDSTATLRCFYIGA